MSILPLLMLAQTFTPAMPPGVPAVEGNRTKRCVPDGGAQMLYPFEGPKDKLRRPFCRELLECDKPPARAEIDALRNDQLPDVFVAGGGHRGRHY